LSDGSYGTLTVDANRSGFVTIRAVNAFRAVFEEITLDDASYVRFEHLKVTGRIVNNSDNSNNIHIVGNDLTGVSVSATPKGSDGSDGPGPAEWVIEYNDIHDCGSFCVAIVSADPDSYWPVSDVVVRGNRIGPMGGGEDAIRIHNWRDLVIEDNEIFGVIEDGQHNDCLQSVWGGKGLVFAGNYLHDNNCQTFFLKDGYTEDIVFEQNLSLRNRAGGAPVVGQIWPSRNVLLRNNTLWDDSGFYIRSDTYDPRFASGPVQDYVVTNNVMVSFLPYDEDQPENRAGLFKDPSILTEDFNVFGGGWTWVPDSIGPHSVEDPSPDFINMTSNYAEDLGSGDWRLTGPITVGGTTYTAGITWRLAGRLFGTEAYGLNPQRGGSSVFYDVNSSVFAADIEWIAARGITKGCNPPYNTKFCPDSNVTRGQMAAFLVRALGLTSSGGDRFVDDSESIFESDINKLGAAGITKGCNFPTNDRFCPNSAVTRGQMAAFLVRALGLTSSDRDRFVDDNGSVFERDINKLAAAGITKGCNQPISDRFCPNSPVTRGQMAAFLHRALD
jgi:hypothetical protein